jgi:hypothetical protein
MPAQIEYYFNFTFPDRLPLMHFFDRNCFNVRSIAPMQADDSEYQNSN